MRQVTVKQSELKPADRVLVGLGPYPFTGPYNCATVTKIVDGIIHLVRPYVHIDEQTGIDYVGVERWTMFQNSERTIIRFEETPCADMTDKEPTKREAKKARLAETNNTYTEYLEKLQDESMGC